MPEMTSRERILAAMRCEEPDRVPVSPFGLSRLDRESAACKRLVALTDPFISGGVAGGNPILGNAADVTTVRDGNFSTTTYHTPAGDLTLRRQFTDITSATVEFPLKRPEDIEKVLSIPYEAPEPDVAPFFAEKARTGEDGLVLAGVGDAICWPADMFSPEDFCLCWADDPDAMEHMVSVAAKRLNAWVEKASAQGVDGWRLVGGEYASVQLGPEAFERLVIQFDREMCNIIHHHGGVAYFHNHGPSMDYLDQFAEVGFDAADPFEAPPWGDCDLKSAMEIIDNRYCVVGNLDDMEIIDKRRTDEVVEIARERLEAAGPRSFFLGGTASGTYTEKGAENFIAMVEVAKDYARASE